LTTSKKPSSELKLTVFSEKSFESNSLSYSSKIFQAGEVGHFSLLSSTQDHLGELTYPSKQNLTASHKRSCG
jgi:hypothetical protein